MLKAFRVAVMLIGVVGTALPAQPSPRVPLNDPAYRALDQIVGSGLVRTVLYGQRPYTRREVARIVAEATSRLATHPVSPATQQILRELALRFLSDSVAATGAHPRVRETSRRASVELLALNSPPRALVPNPLGSADADLNPIQNDRLGKRYAEGGNVAVTAEEDLQFGQHLSLVVAPRMNYGGHGEHRVAEVTLQALSVGLSVKNLIFELGRQPMIWGQGMEGGLLLSSSGRPLNMLRIGTDRPWRLPWVFRYLGPLRGNAFIADLGAAQNFPHAKIAAYKLSAAMTSYFEMGAAVLVHEGGRGSPSATFKERFFDLVPALKYSLPDHSTQFSNKLAGFDFRVRVPMLHNAQIYSEHIFDDIDPRRWHSTLWQDGGHIFGVSLAELGPQGALAVSGEFHHTGLRYYQHSTYTSGVAYNRTLLGDPLGPQGDGANVRISVNRGGSQQFRVNAAIERRGGDIWQTVSEKADDSDFHFALVEARPAEWRQRVNAEWMRTMAPHQRLTMTAAVERVRDASFVVGARRTNSLAGAEWSWFAW